MLTDETHIQRILVPEVEGWGRPSPVLSWPGLLLGVCVLGRVGGGVAGRGALYIVQRRYPPPPPQ